MKRFHVHLAVDDLDRNIHFYSRVFGIEPTVRKADYAKWMLEDPRVNFAISSRGAAAGLNHLGLQVDDDAELRTLRAQVDAAQTAVLDEPGAACCYARSDKYWLTDPQGIAWETFHTLEDIPVFGEPSGAAADPSGGVASGCCAPAAPVAPVAVPVAIARGGKPGGCC